MKATTVLVVEDDAGGMETIRDYLTPDFNVIEAKDGANGLAMAASYRPSLILIDLFLPGLDGVSLCKALRAGQATHSIPIIVMSGMAGDDKRAEVISAGANDFLPKPFRREELLTRIRAKLAISS